MRKPGRALNRDCQWGEKYQGCLADARELAEKPHFVEETSLHGMAWLGRPMPWLQFSRRLARLLGISAQVQAADGHWRQALDESDRVMALGALVGKECKTMIQGLVADAILAIGLHDLRTVASAAPDAALLKAHLGPLLDEDAFRSGMNKGMAGEFQGDVGLFEELRKLDTSELGSSLGMSRSAVPQANLIERHLRASPFFKVNMTCNLLGRAMLPCIVRSEIYTPLPPNPLSEGDLWEIARRVGYLRFARDPLGVSFAFILLPAQDRWVKGCYGTIAQARLTQVCIALRCYQLEHGKLPEALDALAPEYLKAVPLDPFTGKPFGYEPGGQKPRIWSVGPDQRTDPPDAEEADDVVVPSEFAGP